MISESAAELGEYMVDNAGEMRPRIIRAVRLFPKRGREDEVMRCLEAVTRELQDGHPDVAFRSYLAKSRADDGAWEILAESVWDSPAEMRRILVNLDIASKPFEIERYGEALDRWTVTTYEVFHPEPEADA